MSQTLVEKEMQSLARIERLVLKFFPNISYTELQNIDLATVMLWIKDEYRDIGIRNTKLMSKKGKK